MKPIIFSSHARLQMLLRGANEGEVVEAIQRNQWQPAKGRRFQTKQRFAFNKPSPFTGISYHFKEVEAVFVEESDTIVVVTVKVYYSN